jgi:hypothetical protein
VCLLVHFVVPRGVRRAYCTVLMVVKMCCLLKLIIHLLYNICSPFVVLL